MGAQKTNPISIVQIDISSIKRLVVRLSLLDFLRDWSVSGGTKWSRSSLKLTDLMCLGLGGTDVVGLEVFWHRMSRLSTLWSDELAILSANLLDMLRRDFRFLRYLAPSVVCTRYERRSLVGETTVAGFQDRSCACSMTGSPAFISPSSRDPRESTFSGSALIAEVFPACSHASYWTWNMRGVWNAEVFRITIQQEKVSYWRLVSFERTRRQVLDLHLMPYIVPVCSLQLPPFSLRIRCSVDSEGWMWYVRSHTS